MSKLSNYNSLVLKMTFAVLLLKEALYIHFEMMEGPNLSLMPCNEQYVWKEWNQCIIDD